MCHKISCGLAYSVDPDQTAPQEQSDQGLHCLLRYISAPTQKVAMVITDPVTTCKESQLAVSLSSTSQSQYNNREISRWLESPR